MLDTATLQSTSLQGDGVSQSASRKRVIQPQVRTLPNTPQPGVRSPSIDHTLKYLLIPDGAARIRSSYCLRTYDRRACHSRAHEIAQRHSLHGCRTRPRDILSSSAKPPTPPLELRLSLQDHRHTVFVLVDGSLPPAEVYLPPVSALQRPATPTISFFPIFPR